MVIYLLKALRLWRRTTGLLAIFILKDAIMGTPTFAEAAPDYAGTIQLIAQDIVDLQRDFPQLREFSVKIHVNLTTLIIDYFYHTYQPNRRIGVRLTLPNVDGVLFHIRFHDPESQPQIYTQPFVKPMPAVGNMLCIGDKRVGFLIIEGRKTKPLAGRLLSIMKKRGVKECSEQPTPPQ
jgi:hypothetical protein